MKKLLIFIIFVLFFSCNILTALENYDHKLTITIDNSGGSELTNHVISINLDTKLCIDANAMQNDGDDIRFTDSDDTTILNYWIKTDIADLPNSNSSEIWIKIPSIPASSVKYIYLYFGNTSASSYSNLNNTMSKFFEVGTLTCSNSYTTVNLTNTYTNPVLIANTYCDGTVPQSTRVDSLSNNSFKIKVERSDTKGAGSFSSRQVNYFVIEQGKWLMVDGTKIEAYNINNFNKHVGKKDGIKDSWQRINFTHSYSNAPLVFSQVITENQQRWVTDHITNVNTTRFDLSMENAEVVTANAHNSLETLSWLAIEKNKTGTLNDVYYETLTSGDNVEGHGNDDNTPINQKGDYTYSFTNAFSGIPLAITDLRKRDGSDGGWSLIRYVDTTQIGVHTEEDQATDDERNHTKEDISIIAFEKASSIPVKPILSNEPSVSLESLADRWVLVNTPSTLQAGTVSNAITIQHQNYFGETTNVTSDTTIKLASDSPTAEFSLNNAPFTAITELTILSGNNSATFFYKDESICDAIITIAEDSSNNTSNTTKNISTTETFQKGDYTLNIEIDNTKGDALTDYQILVNLNTKNIIDSGYMNNDGSDIRFFENSNLTNELNYWIESGMNTTSTNIWVKIPSLDANTNKTIYMNFGNVNAKPKSSFSNSLISAEVGSINIDENWKTVILKSSYNDPVLVATYYCDGGEEASTRIRNLNTTSFDIKLQNPGDKNIASRNVNYFVMEKGIYETTSNLKIEASYHTETHTIGSSSGDNTWNSITFSHSYTNTPSLFSQTLTVNDQRWVTDHVNNISKTGANIAMEVGQLSYAHGSEKMGWIAIDSNIQNTWKSTLFESIITSDSIDGHDDNGKTFNFKQNFSNTPIIVAELTKRDGSDGGWISIRSINKDTVTFHCEEEDESDNERGHTTEAGNYIAFETSGTFGLRKFTDNHPTISVDEIKDKLVLLNTPSQISAGTKTSQITIQLQNHFGDAINATSDIEIILGSDSETAEFSSNGVDFSNSLSLKILNGSNSANFYYKDDTICTAVITVAAPYLTTYIPGIASIETTESFKKGSYDEPIKIFNTKDPLTDFQIPVTLDTQALILANKMNSSGDDIRFIDDDGSTILPYWIESGMNTINTKIWVKIPSIPVSSNANNPAKTITINYGNPNAKPMSSLSNTMIPAEIGTVTLNDNDEWQTIILKKTYTEPIIVASYICDTGREVSPRIKELSKTTFQVKLQNPEDDFFTPNMINYLVTEKGSWLLSDGTKVEANTSNVSEQVGRRDGQSDTWKTIPLSYTYSENPLVFAQVASFNDTHWITEHINNVSTNQFNLAMEISEINYKHKPEDVNYIAIEYNQIGSLGDNQYANVINTNMVNGHDNSKANGIWNYLPMAFPSPPIVITDIITRRNNNGAWASIRKVETNRVGIHVEEDRKNDNERKSTTESINLINFKQAGAIPLIKYADIPLTPEKNPSKIKFITDIQSILVDRSSSIITVQLQDDVGNPATTSEDINITLTSSSQYGEFSDSSNFSNIITSVTIPKQTSNASFYYRDQQIGNQTITASEDPAANLIDGSQIISVSDVESTEYFRIIELDHSGCTKDHTNYQTPIEIDTQQFINEGKMKADGSDIRFSYDQYGVDSIPFWIQSGINTTKTVIWLKLNTLEAGKVSNIYMRYGNEKLVTASNVKQTMVNTEIGSITVGSTWKTIKFQGIYTNPIVIASYVCDGGIESSTRIRNLNLSTCDIRLTHPAHKEVPERKVYYWVLDNQDQNGKFLTLNNKKIEVGLYEESNVLKGDRAIPKWSRIYFKHEFTTTPLVFSQTLTNNDSRFVTEHVATRYGYDGSDKNDPNRDQGASSPPDLLLEKGFLSALEVTKMNNLHDPETIGWVAIEENAKGTSNGISFEFKLTADTDIVHGHDDEIAGRYAAPYSAFLDDSFTNAPIGIVDLQTRSGGHGSWLSISDNGATNRMDVHIEEDTEDTGDGVRTHPRWERAAAAMFSNTGIIPFRKFGSDSCVFGSINFGEEELGITHLAFKNFPKNSIIQDEITNKITIETRGIDDSIINVTQDVIIKLSTSSKLGMFSTDGVNWSYSYLDSDNNMENLFEITIPSGSNSATFYYKDFNTGNPEIIASEYPSLGWVPATEKIDIQQRHLEFVTDSQTIYQNNVSNIITLQTTDRSGNPVPLGTDTSINLNTTSATGQFSLSQINFNPISQITMPKGTSSISFYYKDSSHGTFIISASENPSYGWKEASQQIIILNDIIEEDYYFDTLIVPLRGISGVPFTLKVIVRNSKDNEIFYDYDGSITIDINYIKPDSGTYKLSINEYSIFVNGIAEIPLTYNDAGTISITVTDNDKIEVNKTSSEILFVPFKYEIILDSLDQIVLKPFEISFKALSKNGNITSNFNRTISLNTILLNPINESKGIFEKEQIDFTNGITSNTFKYNKWGTLQLQVIDTLNPEASNTSEKPLINFHPNSFNVTFSSPPSNRDFYYINEQFFMTVKVLDFLNNTITNYQGSINIQPSDASINLNSYYNFSKQDNGFKSFNISGQNAGNYNTSITDINFKPSQFTSSDINIQYAYIQISSGTVPLGKAEVLVKIVDKNNQLIITDNSTEFTILVQEAISNNTVTLKYKTYKFTNGIAVIEIENIQAEVVTIHISSSTPNLPYEKGVVTFYEGAVQLKEGGLRIDYWREVKNN